MLIIFRLGDFERLISIDCVRFRRIPIGRISFIAPDLTFYRFMYSLSLSVIEQNVGCHFWCVYVGGTGGGHGFLRAEIALISENDQK